MVVNFKSGFGLCDVTAMGTRVKIILTIFLLKESHRRKQSMQQICNKLLNSEAKTSSELLYVIEKLIKVNWLFNCLDLPK